MVQRIEILSRNPAISKMIPRMIMAVRPFCPPDCPPGNRTGRAAARR
jgi:hypothetical protein